MKAKDYAKMLNDNPSIETIKKIADGFLKECQELLVTRHAKSDAAAIAVFKEQDQKWGALCNLVPGLKKDGFRQLVNLQFPEIVPYMGWRLTLGAVDGGEGAGLQASSTPEANPAPEVLSHPAHHH